MADAAAVRARVSELLEVAKDDVEEVEERIAALTLERDSKLEHLNRLRHLAHAPDNMIIELAVLAQDVTSGA